jgi:aromatic ring-opening dioxygenase LigB subunit
MVLSNVYVIPHGDEILSMPNSESATMNKKIKEVTRNDNSDTIVIISPHSLRMEAGASLINTVHLSGYYKIGNMVIRKNYETDRELNAELLKSSHSLIETTFVTTEGKLSRFPLDFGSLIPLSFFGKRKVSLIGQWRTDAKEKLIDLGERIYDVVSQTDRKVSVIFSADQAHAHSRKGPYGYDERAKKYDEIVIKSLRKNDFNELIQLDSEFIQGAKPDSYWNLLSFFGFIREGNMVPRFHYYYVQIYFGMLLATASHGGND